MAKVAKAIMIQGTMSNAGKSLIAAGLCRVFKDDGYSVAPFKSQNMALNSWITDEGLEMGRAQVVQAEAAGVKPSVLMNPVLLKPVTDMGSQVIVLGEVCGNMEAGEYFDYKNTLMPKVMSAYNALAAQFDIIVIEGAGSPAEINLKDRDIVNMGLAKEVRAPVLLAGDIDRGGVFAQLYGTLALLDDDEKDLVKGMIVNKFRGNLELLKPGLVSIEKMCNKKVIGVLPYLDVDIEDEDSLSGRFAAQKSGAVIDVAVVRLPKISNFTDFFALEATVGVGLRYVDNQKLLGNPDVVIVPGTKNTISDLVWLRQTGLEAGIKRLAASGVIIVGICGGYQMLGERVTDGEGVEGGGSIVGMGLLPCQTVFVPEKDRRQVSGRTQAFGGCDLEGYEIHMGRTFQVGGGEVDTQSLVIEHGNVYGTYLHGLFDSTSARKAFFSYICAKKGIDPLETFDLRLYKEAQFDKLGKAVRQNLDMPLIYSILERGV
jgi:adenosylcobyric acid synthase